MSIDPNLLSALTAALNTTAIGAVAAACILQIGQIPERRLKRELAADDRKKLLLAKAVELTLADRTLDLEIAKATRTGGAIIPPAAVNVTKHLEYLEHIYDEGTVPPEVLSTMQKQVDQHNARLKVIPNRVAR